MSFLFLRPCWDAGSTPFLSVSRRYAQRAGHHDLRRRPRRPAAHRERQFSSADTPVSTTGYAGGGLGAAYFLAIDGTGNIWAPNFTATSLSEFSNSGTALSGSLGDTGGGINRPKGVAVDGAGNVWISNTNGNSLTELSSSGTFMSPTSGFNGGTFSSPIGIAIDGSGDVWAANDNNASLTELIGAAAPVVTPIAANLAAPYATKTVNLP